jgi:Ion channel
VRGSSACDWLTGPSCDGDHAPPSSPLAWTAAGLCRITTGRKATLVGKMHPDRIAIVDCLLVGLAATVGTIAIQGLMVHTVIIRLHIDLHRGRIGGRIYKNVTFIAATTLLMLVGISLEVALWALVLELCGEFGEFGTALYYSAGSFTTVGSGSIVLSPRWQLLGPMEAIAGMLMFGISTAVIFTVLQRLIHARFGDSV